MRTPAFVFCFCFFELKIHWIPSFSLFISFYIFPFISVRPIPSLPPFPSPFSVKYIPSHSKRISTCKHGLFPGILVRQQSEKKFKNIVDSEFVRYFLTKTVFRFPSESQQTALFYDKIVILIFLSCYKIVFLSDPF